MIKPPLYQMTASTAESAKNMLDSALELLEAHLKMLAPNDAMVRVSLRKRTPVNLTITLDLTAITTAINEVSDLTEALADDAEPQR